MNRTGDNIPVEVDLELAAGVRIPTPAGPMEVVATPGHVSMHFPEDGLLLAGDGLVADGPEPLVGPKPESTADMDRATESVRLLADRGVGHTLCFHGGYVETGSDRIAEIAEEMRN